jgi:hypothetical protein
VVYMKSSLFRDKTSCIPVKFNRRFGEICGLHLQGRRISQGGNQHEPDNKQSFVEDEGDMFLRNVC